MGRMVGLSGDSGDSVDLDVVTKRLDEWRRNKRKGGIESLISCRKPPPGFAG